MNEDLKQYVPNVHFEQIPIKHLVASQEYQRNLSLSHVDRTSDNFDLYQINPVKVSRRSGVNYVFNGQHTIEIVAQVSGSRDTPVWCMIYDDLSYEMEADIFANQMRFTKALAPYEIFVANIEAGSDAQLTIKALVESYSLNLSGSKTAGNICAISALEHIFTKYGYHVLDQTLYLCVSSWEGDPTSLSGNMLRGVAKLVYCFGASMRADAFVERLSRVSAKEITRIAKERRNGSQGFAETILMFYNRKTKQPLSLAKLYQSCNLSTSMLFEDDTEPENEDSPNQLSLLSSDENQKVDEFTDDFES